MTETSSEEYHRGFADGMIAGHKLATRAVIVGAMVGTGQVGMINKDIVGELEAKK